MADVKKKILKYSQINCQWNILRNLSRKNAEGIEKKNNSILGKNSFEIVQTN